MPSFEEELKKLVGKKVELRSTIALPEGLKAPTTGILKELENGWLILEFTEPESPFKEALMRLDTIISFSEYRESF